MREAVFVERDGILNQIRIERGNPVSPRSLDEFQILSDAAEPLARLKEAGLLLIATTNQPGISRGYQSRRDTDVMHELLKSRFELDDLLMCPHDEMDRCTCRKPGTGMFREAAFKWQIDLDHSYVISDRWQDAQAAQQIGSTSLLVKSPWSNRGHHDFVLEDLGAVVAKLLQVRLGYECFGQDAPLAHRAAS